MNYGLSFDEIVEILKEKGIQPGEKVLAEVLRNAIAEAITRNNEKISEAIEEKNKAVFD